MHEQFVRLDLLSAMTSAGAPGIYFYYDFYPVMVRVLARERCFVVISCRFSNPGQVEYHEKKPGFLLFLTRVCGIIGGVFTMAGVFDGLLHRAQEHVKKY